MSYTQIWTCDSCGAEGRHALPIDWQTWSWNGIDMKGNYIGCQTVYFCDKCKFHEKAAPALVKETEKQLRLFGWFRKDKE